MKPIYMSNSIAPTMVDDEDFPLLNRHTWRVDVKGYVVTNFCGTTVRIHRFILNPSNNDQVDHINLDKLDNRKENLRICNNALNQANTAKREYVNGKRTSSKYKGVHWRKDMNKWCARISHMNTRIQLGFFDNEEDAAIAYNKKALELWGDFARINKIERG
jgi:hypothetical protein